MWAGSCGCLHTYNFRLSVCLSGRGIFHCCHAVCNDWPLFPVSMVPSMHARTHTYTCTHAHTYTCTRMHARTHTRMHARTQHACTHTHTHIYSCRLCLLVCCLYQTSYLLFPIQLFTCPAQVMRRLGATPPPVSELSSVVKITAHRATGFPCPLIYVLVCTELSGFCNHLCTHMYMYMYTLGDHL